MRRIAIIPVKRRSRRLPEKNIRTFDGAPMFVHSIAAAQKSGLFERIVVSTSDSVVVETSRTNGVDVHVRDKKLDQDEARLVDVCTAVLESEAVENRTYDLMVLLMATAPLRTAGDIADGNANPLWPELVQKRAEEVPTLRVDNGSTYALHVASFREEKTFYVNNLRAYEMPRDRSVDLDEPEDLALLEFFAARNRIDSESSPA
jgi:CMP-N,N'-diacetyllegionaminic acid synthase